MESKKYQNRIRRSISLIRSDRGQIIVEYILLLVVAVGIAALIMSKITKRADGDEAGLMVKKWRAIQTDLGNDLPDKCVGSGCSQGGN